MNIHIYNYALLYTDLHMKYVWVTNISAMNDFFIVLQVLRVLDVCEKLYPFWFRIWGIFLVRITTSLLVILVIVSWSDLGYFSADKNEKW